MILNIENLFHIITISLTLIFSFYIFLNITKERYGNLFIGFFIFYLGLESLEVLLSQTAFYKNHPLLFLIIPNLAFLLYPSFFLYIRSIVYKGLKLERRDLLHIIPYLIIVIIMLFEYYLKPREVQLNIMTNNKIPWFIIFFYYSLRIQGFFYLILLIRITYRYKKIVEENYSNIKNRNYKWIIQLTFVFTYFVIAALISNLLRFALNDSYEKIAFYFFATISLTFLIWLIYKVMSQPYLFNGVDSNIKLLREYLVEKNNNVNKSLNQNVKNDNKHFKELEANLEKFVTTNEVFLNPSLTIFELAEGLNMKSIDLSSFLNKNLNKNFFDYINEYRIKRAMQILQDPNKKNLTVLEILYEVGFNSKSSFNTAFKKYTNLTPTQYRKNSLK